MYPVTDKLEQRLRKAHFRVRAGERSPRPPDIRFVAQKLIFTMPFVIVSCTFVVVEKDGATAGDFDGLFNPGFKLAKRMNWVPLLRGMQFGYVILPLIVGKNIDDDTLLYVASAPTSQRFCCFQFPVAIDLSGGRLVFFEGWQKWGGAIWPGVQKLITKHIEPLTDEAFPE